MSELQLDQVLTPEEWQTLNQFFQKGTTDTFRDLHQVEGFLWAVTQSPLVIPPNHWLERLFGHEQGKPRPDGAIFNSVAQREQLVGYLLRLYQEINRLQRQDRPQGTVSDPLTMLSTANPSRHVGSQHPENDSVPAMPLAHWEQWAQGFKIGYEWLEPTWEDTLGWMQAQGFAQGEALETHLNACLSGVVILADQAEWVQLRITEPSRPNLQQILEQLPMQMQDMARLGNILAPAARRVFDGARPDIAERSVAIKAVGRNDRCPCGSGRKYKHCCGNRR